MRVTVLLALFGLFAAGCDKNPVRAVVTIPLTTQRNTWIGSYSGIPGPGDLVLDLTQTGTALAGEIVFGTPASSFPVSGSVSADSMFLTLDPRFPNPSDLSLRAQMLSNGGLSGTMYVAFKGLNVTLTCRSLTRRSIDSDKTYSVPFDVFGMVYDGSRLWLSSSLNYILMNPDGTLADTVEIYHNPPLAHWISDVVMYDGTLLWGVFPITIMGPGGSTNVADLLAFTADGRAPDSLRIEHKPMGLAHDGVHSWSLRSEPPALIQFDGTGAVTDSLHVGIPDAYLLVFDGAHFWTVGWFQKQLYELDTSGQVLSVCDLPSAGLPVGLAVEGSHIWYGAGLFNGSMLHRMTIR